MSRTIGIISVKGGVGKTTTVSNIASILANDFKQKVLVVDANFSAPNLGIHLGAVKPEVSLHDVLEGKETIGDSVYKHNYGFWTILGDLTNRKVDVYKLEEELDKIKDQFDLIILDSSPNLNHEIASTIKTADELYIVSTPDYPTLSTTLQATKVAKNWNTPIKGIVLNKVFDKGFELSVDDIERVSDVPVVIKIPHDINVIEALSITKPASLHKPMSDASIEYKKFAAALIGKEFSDPRFKTLVKNVLLNKKDKTDFSRSLLKEEFFEKGLKK